MEEVLSRLLHSSFEGGRIGKFFHHKGCPLIFHLLNVNDLLVFTNGEWRSLHWLQKMLETYECWSRQAINKSKLALFIFNEINNAEKKGLLWIAGFAEESFPYTYLEPLVIPRRLTNHMLENLVHRIQNKVASWEGKMLSSPNPYPTCPFQRGDSHLCCVIGSFGGDPKNSFHFVIIILGGELW